MSLHAGRSRHRQCFATNTSINGDELLVPSTIRHRGGFPCQPTPLAGPGPRLPRSNQRLRDDTGTRLLGTALLDTVDRSCKTFPDNRQKRGKDQKKQTKNKQKKQTNKKQTKKREKKQQKSRKHRNQKPRIALTLRFGASALRRLDSIFCALSIHMSRILRFYRKP